MSVTTRPQDRQIHPRVEGRTKMSLISDRPFQFGRGEAAMDGREESLTTLCSPDFTATLAVRPPWVENRRGA